MKKIMIIGTFALSTLGALNAHAGNHGPCKIEKLTHSDGSSNYMIVKMGCEGSSLPTNCTNLSADTVVYDVTTEQGKARTSLLLSAFVAGKDVRISSYGMCPSEVSSAPLVYSVSVE